MRNTLLSLVLFIFSSSLLAQPELCGPDPDMTSFCDDACIICDLDGFQGTSNSATNGVAPPGFCTIIQHNVGWIGFIATSEDLTLDITVQNCSGGGGLEVAIYESFDCDSYELVSNCLGAFTHIPNNTTGTIFNIVPLVIGQYYYFVMDGNGGAVCDFEVTVTLGSTEVKPPQAINEIFGETSACTQGTYEYSIDTVTGSPMVIWTLEGDEVAEGNPVDIHFPDQGVFELCVEASNICSDSSVTQCINATVVDLPSTDQISIICPTQCIELNNTLYCDEGNYEVIFQSVNGCDSLVFLEINHLEESFTEIIDTICSGQQIVVGNEIFYETGDFEVILENSVLCDSLITVSLYVTPPLVELVFEKICQGEVFEVGGEEFSSQGVYFLEGTTNEGCDSIFELHLEVEPLIPTFLFEEICPGDSIMIGDEVFNESGEYQIFLVTQGDCDSLIELELEVISNALTELDEQICNGDSVVIGNEVFTESGSYVVIFEGNNAECDSAVVLDLVVYEDAFSVVFESICQGDSVELNGEFLSDSGIYEVHMETQFGCDSIVFLDLRVIESLDTFVVLNICLGDSIEFNGSYYSESEIVDAVFESNQGCDSLVVLDLQVVESVVLQLDIEICQGDSVELYGQEFKEEGDYEILVETEGACDSLVELSLFHLEATSNILNEKICTSDSIQIGDDYFTESGVYNITLQGVNTCDSFVELTLEVLTDDLTLIQEEICSGDSTIIGGVTFFEEGEFLLVLENDCGCDSVLQIEIHSQSNDTTMLEVEICSGQIYSIGNESFDEDGMYEVILSNNSACDSLILLDLTTKPCELHVEVENEMLLCHGDSSGSLIFDIVSGAPAITYEWVHLAMEIPGSSGVIVDISEDIVLDNLVAGIYRIILSDQDGNIDTFFAEVFEPEMLSVNLILSKYGNNNVSCAFNEDGFISATVSGGTEPYTYLWNIGEDQPEIQWLGAGNYELTITDYHGCQNIVLAELLAPEPILIDYLLTKPSCDFPFGSLEIIDIAGGSGTFQSSLNQGPLIDGLVYENLSGGDFQLAVIDEFECQGFVEFEFENIIPAVLDLGADITLGAGETYQIDPIFTIFPDSFVWSGEGLSCKDCLDPSWQGSIDALIGLEIFSESGCSAYDEFLVNIDTDRAVYAPNVFSPNSDGLNDVFTLYAPNYVIIQHLSVYSRWGELVFDGQNIPVNDDQYGWDGTFKSEPLNPGIYAWSAKVIFIDGLSRIISGEISLVR